MTSYEKSERRKYQRYIPLKEIFLVNEQFNYETEIGFLYDISLSGARLLVDEKDMNQLGNSFKFKIYLPRKVRAEFIELGVRQAWKTNELIHGYFEVGCSFEKLTERQAEVLNLLMEFYEKLSHRVIEK